MTAKKYKPAVFTVSQLRDLADTSPPSMMSGILFDVMGRLSKKDQEAFRDESGRMEIVLLVNGREADFKGFVEHLESQFDRCVKEAAAEMIRKYGYDFQSQCDRLAEFVEKTAPWGG